MSTAHFSAEGHPGTFDAPVVRHADGEIIPSNGRDRRPSTFHPPREQGVPPREQGGGRGARGKSGRDPRATKAWTVNDADVIVNATRCTPHESLRGVVAQLGSKKFEEQIMTLADRLRQEGREKGIDEGRVTTLRANLRRVLIRRKLSISPEELARIEECDAIDTLERWHDQAVDATSTADALR